MAKVTVELDELPIFTEVCGFCGKNLGIYIPISHAEREEFKIICKLCEKKLTAPPAAAPSAPIEVEKHA